MRRPSFRFLRLQTKLSVLYVALFGATLLLLAVVAQAMIWQHARATVEAELAASGEIYDRLWALRAESLGAAGDVLARDFGFRTAVATGDALTIESALANLRQRAGTDRAFVVDTGGVVLGGEGALAAAVATAPFELREGRRDAVVFVEGAAWRLVVTPVLAPVEIGWVVFAERIDVASLSAMSELSALPLTAQVLRRDADRRWTGIDGSVGKSGALDALLGDHGIATLWLGGRPSFATARLLAAPTGAPQAAILIRYGWRAALAPYLPLGVGIALSGLVGLLFVIAGSRRLARSIALPIAELDAAARALEEGSRAKVVVEGDDEIGRLAASFNRMAAGIVERETRISHIALHDNLTGLPNRAFFRNALDQGLSSVARSGGGLALLSLDLDRFKDINDTLGHPVGDALLRAIGTRLTDLAPDGTVFRLSGDEFAILLQGSLDPDRPRALSQSIIDASARPIEAAGHLVAAEMSVGIAIGPSDGSDAETLLKNCDLALYRAKQDGRGVFRFFEPALDAAARRRRQIELDLRDALRLGQFELFMQPVVDVRENRIGGFEALLRWRHPERGLVPPTEFISIAEDTGMIVAIGEWVIQEACRQATCWPVHVRVAVNVSPLQFRSRGLVTVIVQALAASGLDPARLEIEMTETVFLDGEATVIALLEQLRAIGVRIALDDFGTGYSSLSYLRRFPFDKIKIDRSFVETIAVDPCAAAIVRAIVQMAQALNVETTAEGVEDADQLQSLEREGCDYIQGYLFSRPVRADDVLAMFSGATSSPDRSSSDGHPGWVGSCRHNCDVRAKIARRA